MTRQITLKTGKSEVVTYTKGLNSTQRQGMTIKAVLKNKSNVSTNIKGSVASTGIWFTIPETYVNSTNLPANVKVYTVKGGIETLYDEFNIVTDVVETAPSTPTVPTGPVVSTPSRLVPVVIFVGESNSGGQASLNALTTQEKLPRPAVQILNNTTLQFEDLHIGVNANIDHYNLPANTTHGWEAGLALQVEAGNWYDDKVYLIKTGQGGSLLSQWAQGQTFWTKFVTRINAAKEYFEDQGLIPQFYVWHTHGINDALAGTAAATWKTQMKELHTRIRKELGFVPIMLVENPSQYPTYNEKMVEISQETAGNFMIDTTGLTMDDSNHWNSPGMKELASRLGAYSRTFGQDVGYMLGQSYALFAGGVTTQPVSGGGGTDPEPTPSDPGSGLGAYNSVVWDNLQHTENYSGTIRRFEGGLPAGAMLSTPINAQQPFGIQIEYPDLPSTNAIIVYVDDDNTPNFAQQNNPFLAGVFQYNGGVYYVNSGEGQESAGSSGATNRLRMIKNGNDVDLYKSTDNGATFQKISTITGALVGKTNIYLKVLFAIENNGQSIPVSLARPA